jgi:hypothetical protein
MKGRLVLLLVCVGVLIGITAATGLADPNLSPVPAHRHFIQLQDGTRVAVGPDLCDNPDSVGIQQAFYQFHNNLHIATSSSIGPAAPGLHNLSGAEIKSGPC